MLRSFTSRTNENIFSKYDITDYFSISVQLKTIVYLLFELIYKVNDKISTHTDCGCADLKDKVLEVISSV